jgi:hypothetical protein
LIYIINDTIQRTVFACLIQWRSNPNGGVKGTTNDKKMQAMVN